MTAKPASAPPADALRRFVESLDCECDPAYSTVQCGRCEALAASAQVREVEPLREFYEAKAAGLGWNRADGEGCVEFLMRQAYATGHKDAIDQRSTHGPHAPEPAPVALRDGGWIAYGDHRRIVIELEASLAACREDEAWTLYLQDWIGDAAVGVLRKEFKELHPSATNPNENQTP
jgi:hypothetical protein